MSLQGEKKCGQHVHSDQNEITNQMPLQYPQVNFF